MLSGAKNVSSGCGIQEDPFSFSARNLKLSLRAQRSNPKPGYDSYGLLRRFAPRNDGLRGVTGSTLTLRV
jgi:hypothetical protein